MPLTEPSGIYAPGQSPFSSRRPKVANNEAESSDQPLSLPGGVDKSTPQTYYFRIMASGRVQRQIDRLLDEAEEAVAVSDWARASHFERCMSAGELQLSSVRNT